MEEANELREEKGVIRYATILLQSFELHNGPCGREFKMFVYGCAVYMGNH